MSPEPPRTTLTIAVLNIRHGGGKRRSALATALPLVGADVVVLPEWTDTGEPPMQDLIIASGWSVVPSKSDFASRTYGVAIASPHPLVRGGQSVEDSERLVHGIVTIGGQEVDILGVYVPSGSPDRERKHAFLDQLAGLTSRLDSERPTVMAGDFNCDHVDATGALSKLVGEPRFGTLFAAGWTDTHRAVAEPTQPTFWDPRTRRGFKIDHVLHKGPLRPLTSTVLSQIAEHGLAAPQAKAGAITDHAMLLTRLEIAGEEPVDAPT